MEKIWLKNYDPGVPHSMNYPPVPLQGLLEETAKRFGGSTAIIFPGALGDDKRLTYKELEPLINRMANALVGLGVKRGDRVTLLLPNCPQFVIAYYAILKAGGVVVATNPLYSPREMEHQFKDCQAETAIVLSLFYNMVAGLREKCGIKNIVVTNIKEFLPPVSKFLFTRLREKKEGHRVDISGEKNTYSFQALLHKSSPEPPRVQVGPDDIAMLQYTGGTTGTSKGAVALHRNVVANVYQMRSWAYPVRLNEGEETLMGVMPFFHVYGMVTVLHMAVLTGSTMLLLPRWDTKQVLKCIAKYRPAFFPGVPTMYVALNNHPDVRKYDLRSIAACTSGAAPLPIEVQEQFEKLTGGKLAEGFGLSEAPVVVTSNPIMGPRKVGSIGVPFPDVEAKIVDVETGEKEMPVGEIGELIVRAPQVMKEYWNKPEETKKVLRNGWLYTGDLATMDRDGWFSIVDRKKEMIIAGGYNIYPREIEEVLYEHPKILEVACFGVPDPYRGQNVKVSIVLKPGETCTAAEITEYCQPLLAKFKIPKLIEFRDSLPKSLIGKVLKRVLIEEEAAKTQQASRQ